MIKEYNNKGSIIYEGEYLNGKGKMYVNNILIYEGEFLNEEKNGKGKLYDLSGNLKYEGEFLNDKMNGKGTEYYQNGKL